MHHDNPAGRIAARRTRRLRGIVGTRNRWLAMATGSVVRSDAATANAVDVLDPFYTEPSALHWVCAVAAEL
jgi:hypothetical protein